MSNDEPVKIYDAWNSLQAHFLVQSFAEAGIPARVASDALEGLVGKIPFHLATCPVWVAKSDVEPARAIVRQYESRLEQRSAVTDESAEPFCYHCGASIADRRITRCGQCDCELDWSE